MPAFTNTGKTCSRNLLDDIHALLEAGAPTMFIAGGFDAFGIVRDIPSAVRH